MRYLTQFSSYNGEDVGDEEWESRIRLLYKNGQVVRNQVDEINKKLENLDWKVELRLS